MKKLKLLAQEIFFWIPIVLMLILILTVVMIISGGEKIDWGLMVFVSIMSFLVSGVMLGIAIQSANEKLKLNKGDTIRMKILRKSLKDWFKAWKVWVGIKDWGDLVFFIFAVLVGIAVIVGIIWMAIFLY